MDIKVKIKTLQTLSLKELKQIAQFLGVEDYENLTKIWLIKKIKDHEKQSRLPQYKTEIIDLPDDMIYEICEKMTVKEIKKFMQVHPRIKPICKDIVDQKAGYQQKRISMTNKLLSLFEKNCFNYRSFNEKDKNKCKDILFLIFDNLIDILNNKDDFRGNYHKLKRDLSGRLIFFSDIIPEIATRYAEYIE